MNNRHSKFIVLYSFVFHFCFEVLGSQFAFSLISMNRKDAEVQMGENLIHEYWQLAFCVE